MHISSTLKKHWAFFSGLSLLLASLAFLFSSLVVLPKFLLSLSHSYQREMGQFTSTTGKMAPETFLNFLQDLEKSTQHFWWYQLIVIALLIIGLTFFITYYYHWQRPTKSFWVKSWPINRFLLFVGLFLFCLLVLSQEQINTFFKDQIATNVAEKINQTLPASFTHANTNSAMLLPFSSKNFLTLNEYLQSTRLSLLQPFALIYCGGVAYSNLLLFFLQQKKTSGAI